MTISSFLAANRELVVFIYGQVFFLMGMAIALQSRRYSRLDLARSLSWLAAFGIVHGIYEWGDILIPIQRQVLSESLLRLLTMFYLVLLGASFAFLFKFGTSLLQSFTRGQMSILLSSAPVAVSLAWAVLVFFLLPPFIPVFDDWQRIANAAARYAIGLPGALLAAYGLRRHAKERIASLHVPHLVGALRLAGISLALYAFFGGLITPRVPFPPGSVLNAISFQEATGLPVILFRSITGLLLALTIIRALEVFDVETARMIEAMEQKQILANERDRIGRDLHDGAIQMVYTAGLLVDSARNQASGLPALKDRLDKAVLVINDAITALRQNLVELRPAPLEESLADGLRALAADARFTSFVSVNLENHLSPEDASALQASSSPIRQSHILAIVNEALTNTVRHAHARKVNIRVSRADGHLRVSVQDDGVGLPKDLRAGYGLRNMRDRARLMGGALSVTDEGKRGARITLDIPWDEI